MNLVQLYYDNVAEIVGTKQMALLTITDAEHKRQLVVPCDSAMARQFILRESKEEMVQRLLPEVLWSLLRDYVDDGCQLIINGIDDGQYQVILFNSHMMQTVPIRMSDAVLLSLVSGIPLLIGEDLLERQGTPVEKSNKVAIPVNALSSAMLRKALGKAISEENYEQAKQLHEEIQRRSRLLDNPPLECD